MNGHIRLGKLTDVDAALHDYVLVDINRYQAATANPFIARVNTGGKYNEQDTFSDWTIQDWHSGVGNEDPEQGPQFALADTRFPGYAMLPLGFEYPLSQRFVAFGDKTDGSETTLLSSRMYSISFTAPKTGNIDRIWVNVSAPFNVSLTCELRADSATRPGTVLKTATVSSYQSRVHMHKVLFTFTPQAVTAGTRYHVALKTTKATALDGGVAPYFCSAIQTGEYADYSEDGGTTWIADSSLASLGIGLSFIAGYETTDQTIKGIYTNASSVFVWHANTLSKIVSGDLVAKVTEANIYDVKQIGTALYIACGTSYHVYDMATEADSEIALTAFMFVFHGGYLWRSLGDSVAYTADEVTWVVLDSFVGLGSGANEITGMAGLGQDLYVSTAQGMYMIAPGDVAVQANPWPEPNASNGVGMVSWEGALYIPLTGGAIMRYDSSGAMLNVGINAKMELPGDMRGDVVLLYPSTYFLYAVVDRGANIGHSSLWSFNGDGWHCLGLGPQNLRGGGMTIDRTNEHLYWGFSRNMLMRAKFLASVNNPERDQAQFTLFAEGWIEYAKFFAGTNTLDKDFDRVHLHVENGIAYDTVVYWRDETHNAEYYSVATQYGWMLAGRPAFNGDGTLSFPAAARPQGRWLRIAVRLSKSSARPVLRGMSVKYSTALADRWRWVLPILISDGQQMVDGTLNPYTAAQQKTHLDMLIAEVPPLRFVDLAGDEHVVKVTGASSAIARYEWEPALPTPAPEIQWVYTLQLEEVT